MVLYNVTITVEDEIAEDWLAWMQAVHIPDVLSTGLFMDNKLFRLLSHAEDGHQTFSAQYFLQTEADYDTYTRDHAPALQAESFKRYGDRTAAFRTLLQQID
jgi:hypothetical protein